MAGRSTVNWELYLSLISMGMAPKDAVQFVRVSVSAPYSKAGRDHIFRRQLDDATELGVKTLKRSPHYWLDPRGNLILDSAFNPVPREPSSKIWAWVWAQVRRNPLANLAA